MTTYFHTLPSELGEWLKLLLEEHDHWCWISQWEDSFLLENRDHIDRLDLFPDSQAIQISPSHIHEDMILTEGSIGISPRPYCEDVGIDFAPYNRWYQSVRRSFMKLVDRSWMVVTRAQGQTTEHRDIWLTPGAVRWCQDGKRLKQIPENPWHRDIAPRTPRKRGKKPG
jgi:hypothetical protein